MNLISAIPYFEKLAEAGHLSQDKLEVIRKEVEALAKAEVKKDDSSKEIKKEAYDEEPVRQNLWSKLIQEINRPSTEVTDIRDLNEKKSIWEELQKISSVHIKDLEFKDLPKATQKDVARFADCQPETKLIHYGAVVKELLPKVDKHNYDSALEHLNNVSIDKDEIYKKLPTKYILIANDSILDGHHFLAKCEKAGITNSLNVLDLTPVRFQKKEATIVVTVDPVFVDERDNDCRVS